MVDRLRFVIDRFGRMVRSGFWSIDRFWWMIWSRFWCICWSWRVIGSRFWSICRGWRMIWCRFRSINWSRGMIRGWSRRSVGCRSGNMNSVVTEVTVCMVNRVRDGP